MAKEISDQAEILSLCRQCGGDRYHKVVASKRDPWEENENVSGCDIYYILECGGCRTVSFLHRHWFSEDHDWTDEGISIITHNDVYPPSPRRKMPEWGSHVFLEFTSSDVWILHLHKEIYAAAALRSYALAAMGARTIIDYIVSFRAGDSGSFQEKLDRLEKGGIITNMQNKYYYDAFDAGSAAAHRGYRPKETDLFTLFDVAEGLIERFYIQPAKDRDLAIAVDELKAKTPVRKK